METTQAPTTEGLKAGTVASLNQKAGFGYVDDADGQHRYIFVFGTALKHSQARMLTVGKPVKFRVSGHGRVDELVIS
ncbi:cold shock domain-containing protein [Methylibium petroleiphilum]|nr:cold shock domain-containing protein [Methylibium petroleiphilum]